MTSTQRAHRSASQARQDQDTAVAAIFRDTTPGPWEQQVIGFVQSALADGPVHLCVYKPTVGVGSGLPSPTHIGVDGVAVSLLLTPHAGPHVEFEDGAHTGLSQAFAVVVRPPATVTP